MKPLKLITDSARIIFHEGCTLLRLDLTSAIVVLVFLGFFLPTIARYAENANMLAAFIDDEPFITMQVDGMTTRPYGNPANYLDKKHVVPPHWGNIRYDGLIYYGGLYLDMAFTVWAPLKLAGLPIFPTLPVVLRAIALLFTVATLLAVYNIGRIYMGRMAALIALLYMATNYQLLRIGTVIHPDSLLFFLTFLSLVLCVRHARDGALESLLAIGIVAGLAQATKMGGAPLIPIVCLSVMMGIRRHNPINNKRGTWVLSQILKKGLILAFVAVTIFIIFTPYAVLDPYFINTWEAASKIFIAGSPTGQTAFFNWCTSFYYEVGPVLLSACGLALIGRYNCRDRSESIPIIFYLILALSIFFYYASFQKIWVQLQYLIITFAFIATVAGYILDQLFNRIFSMFIYRSALAATLSVAVAATALTIMEPRLYRTAVILTEYAGWRHAPQMQVGEWLQENQPHANGSVLIDNQTYFNPHAFPAQFHSGGPITYTKLAQILPDYFVLTVYYMDNWMSQKMRHQRNDAWDSAYESMRLYQDLLGYDHNNVTIQKDIPGIQFIKAFGDHARKINGIEPVTWKSGWDLIFNHSEILASRSGRSFFLFHLDPVKFVDGIPDSKKLLSAKAFASSTAFGGYDVNNLMSDNQMVWVSAKSGKDAIGEYVGIDYGKTPLEPHGLFVKWIGYNWRPRTLDIQFSNNGNEWQSNCLIPLAIHPDPPLSRDNGTERWEEYFPLPATGKHRYWRVVAHDVLDTQMFGMERLRFDISKRIESNELND